MRNKLILLVALLFAFVLVAGSVQAVTSIDDKAKSSVQKEDCCKKGTAEAKAECKDKADCKGQQAGCCEKKAEASKDKAGCASKEGGCPSSCPAKAACEKK